MTPEASDDELDFDELAAELDKSEEEAEEEAEESAGGEGLYETMMCVPAQACAHVVTGLTPGHGRHRVFPVV
jgi:hypothetical protein